MNVRVVPILLTFFLMGLADAMGPLSDGVKDNYELSNVTSTLLTFGVFIAFAVFSVPGGLLAARIGKKKLLLLGLGINAAALVLPSIFAPPFPVLLGCIFMLGVGTTFLQVAGNPIMRDVSDEGRYSRNLALGDLGYLDRPDRWMVSARIRHHRLKPLGPMARYVIQLMGWVDRSTRMVNLGDGFNLDATVIFTNDWYTGGWFFCGWPLCDDRETRSAGDVSQYRRMPGVVASYRKPDG